MSFNNALACLLALVLAAGLAYGSAPPQSDTLPPIGLDTLLDRMNENGSTVESGRLFFRREVSYSSAEGQTVSDVHEAEVWSDGVRVRLVDEVQEWLHPIEGLWLPRLATFRRYHVDRTTGQEEVVRTARSQVLSAAFNIAIPDDVFKLELPETTEMVPWGD